MQISIEVVYGTSGEQVLIPLNCEHPITISQAVKSSGILDRFPEIELKDNMVGVYGYRQALSHPLRDGDRVEIYRPLHLSPNEARKMRAALRKRRQNRS